MMSYRLLFSLVLGSTAVACGGAGGGLTDVDVTATISASPTIASFTAPVCFTSPCTVSDTFTITSSTAWTSATPGFGSLGEAFSFLPTTGSAGSTMVIVSYRSYGVSTPPSSPTLLTESGFLRFRTTVTGVYTDVDVTVYLSRP
jgi:hypothetical protein